MLPKIDITHEVCGCGTAVCPDNEEWLKRIRNRVEFTYDCPHCDGIVFVEYTNDERIAISRDLNAALHERSDGEWPLDGRRTGFIDLKIDENGSRTWDVTLMGPDPTGETA